MPCATDVVKVHGIRLVWFLAKSIIVKMHNQQAVVVIVLR